MRAAFMVGNDTIEIRNATEPHRGETDSVLVETDALAFCMTDVAIIKGHMKTKKLPIVVGHEASGVVVGKTDDVTNVETGDRVLIDPNHSDLICPSCRRGFYNLCVNGGLMGREEDGVFREQMVLPSRSMYRLPKGIQANVGPLIQPLSTVVHAHRRLDIAPGDTVLVLGLGVTGLMLAQVAKLRGAFVIATSTFPEKLELAKGLGVDVLVNRTETDLLSKVMEVTQRRGADVAIDSTGYPSLLEKNGLELVRPHGTILLFATRMNQLGLDSFESYRREITFMSTRSSLPQDFEDAIKLGETNQVDLKYQITETFPFEKVSEAFDYFQDRTRVLKTVITVNRN